MEKVIEYISNLLNIDLSNDFVIADISNELSKHDQGFVQFLRENHSSDKLNYKTGFQKFLYLSDKYKEKQLQLSENETRKVYDFSDALFSKTLDVFSLLYEEIQKGEDIDSNLVTRFLYANFNEKERKVLRLVGNRKILLQRFLTNKSALKQELEEAVRSLTVKRKNLELGYIDKKEQIDNKILKLIGSTK